MRKDPEVTLPTRAVSAGCSYFGVRIVRHVRRDMADLAARGYSGVLHTFSENDFAYYRGTMREIVEASVAGFLRDVVAHVASLGGRSTICLLPATEGTHGISDWNTVASLPGLTTFATDPYWKHWNEPAEPFVRRFARLLSETCERHGVRSQLWVPCFGLTKEEIPELDAAIAAAREEGVDDLWTWSYEACGSMTSLATQDAPLVWEAVSAALTGKRQRPTEDRSPWFADLELR